MAQMDRTDLDVAVWTTRADQSLLLAHRRHRTMPAVVADAPPTIEVNPSVRCQDMDGFGFALTGGSAELISRLAPARRQALLHELFSDTASGLGLGFLRISIGASDLSRACFTYYDGSAGHPDPKRERFYLGAGDVDVVPILKEILAVNPGLRILATPWSAPPSMKTNGSFIGGALKKDHYRDYAEYLIAYIAAMRARGIGIGAITPQNEPLNTRNEPSMEMSAAEQADFIANHLGPLLRDAGFGDVELFCYDHNCDRPDYPLSVLSNDAARPFITGVAWHLYGGSPEALSQVAVVHPDVKMYLTEQWVGADGQFGNDLIWHMRNVVIGTIRNGARAVFEWNLAGDPDHGPHTPGGAPNCVGALTIDAPDTITRNVAYYIIGHLSRFVPPRSVRVLSSEIDSLPNVAFATPQGRMVMLALNDSETAQTFRIRCDGRVSTQTLPGRAVATYVWPARAPAASAEVA